MVVLPRHARRRGANPYGSPHHSSYSPSPIHHGGHGNGTYHGGPPPRFSQQSIILILAGMGLGYMITINMGSSSNQLATNGGAANNLDAIVKNLEQQRAASAAASSRTFGDNINTNMKIGGSSSSSSSGAGAVVDNLSSPMNMMNNQHHEAPALLRGDASSNHNHAMHNHRILSTPSADNVEQQGGDYADGEEEEVGGDVSVHSEPEDASAVSEREDISEEEEGGAVVVESERRESEVRPLAVNQQHHTFTEQADVVEDLSEAQQRFIETQKLIASQSIPTPTNPHVMKTVSY